MRLLAALPSHPRAASAVLLGGLLALAVTLAVGMSLLRVRGGLLWPIGLAGVLLVVLYTPWITCRPWASLLAPGLGVGPLMVVGTHVALGGTQVGMALMTAWAPGCLASALLLLNQFPDREADQAVGRRNLVIVLGRPAAAHWVLGLHGLAAAGLGLGVLLHSLPPARLWGMLPVLLTWPLGRQLLRHADTPAHLLPAMTLNVAAALAVPTSMALTLLLCA